jgi:hypothetical protein
MTLKQYWYEFDIDGLNNAINVACFPKEVSDWIFERDIKPFQVFNK